MQPQSSTLKKKISLQDFQIKRIIGKGSYGDVFLAIKDCSHYAMKEIIKKKLHRQKKQYQAMVERQLLRCMRHPGIIKLKYAFQDKNKLYFIMQYCQLGEFIRFMKQYVDNFTQHVRKFYIAQMVNLLQYLHINGITHRDLKPQNLLLSKDGHLKLVDFGTSEISQCKLLSEQFKQHIQKQKDKQIYSEDEIIEQPQPQEDEVMSPRKRRSTFVGTSYYISPQLLEQNFCEPPSDLWALGCIIYQLYYLETPFKDTTEYGVFEKIKKVQLEFPKNDIINDDAVDLIKKLLIKNPQERLGSCSREELDYKHLKAHPYFTGIDVDLVYAMVPPDVGVKKFSSQTEENLGERKKDFVGLAKKMLDEQVAKQSRERSQHKESEQSTQDKQDTPHPQQSSHPSPTTLIQGIIEKREFPYYEFCYLRIYSNNQARLVRLDKVQKIEQLEVLAKKQEEQHEVANALDKEKGTFSVEMINKGKEVFRTGEWEKWVEVINQRKVE